MILEYGVQIGVCTQKRFITSGPDPIQNNRERESFTDKNLTRFFNQSTVVNIL